VTLTFPDRILPPWVGIANIRHTDPVGLSRILSGLEAHDRQRYTTFRSKKRQHEFLLGRWLLHRATTAWLGDASGVTFDSTPTGIPYVIAPDGYPPITASLSHAGGWFACALTFNGALGIDIEPIIKRDFEAMDDLALYDSGHTAIKRLPVDIQPLEFYKRWTLHEARIKIMHAGHLPSPALAHTCLIHNNLMLSLCIADEVTDPAPLCVMEWMGDTEFRICEAASWQAPVLYTADLCASCG